MSTYTPGPWRATKDTQIMAPNPQIARAPAVEIAQVHNVYGHDGFCQASGNVNLIAAAPELLEALIQMNQLFVKVDMTENEAEVCRMALAAIAKAEGRAR